MALRPFTRHSKSEADAETALDEDDGVDQFFSKGPRPFSNESRPASTPQGEADQNRIPATQSVEAPETANAGWYPDASDPELKRYWDGHHWTGQTMKVIPERRQTSGPVSAPVPDATPVDQSSSGAVVRATDLLMPNQPVVPDRVVVPEKTVVPSQTVVPDQVVVPEKTVVTDQPDRLPSVEAASTAPELTIPSSGEEATVRPHSAQPTAPAPSVGANADARGVARTGAPKPVQGDPPSIEPREIADMTVEADTATTPPEANREADRWFAEVARAVGRAQETESPEDWEEAARVAIVVSEVAQTMRVMAEAELHAQAAAHSAQEATQKAALAEKQAAEANGTVTETARTARIAADEARAAAQTAEEARRTAERAAEEVPRSAGLARVAVQEAAKAVGNAKGIGEIVAKARLANTQEAWNEALGLVTTKSETARDLTGGADSTV